MFIFILWSSLQRCFKNKVIIIFVFVISNWTCWWTLFGLGASPCGVTTRRLRTSELNRLFFLSLLQMKPVQAPWRANTTLWTSTLCWRRPRSLCTADRTAPPMASLSNCSPPLPPATTRLCPQTGLSVPPCKATSRKCLHFYHWNKSRKGPCCFLSFFFHRRKLRRLNPDATRRPREETTEDFKQQWYKLFVCSLLNDNNKAVCVGDIMAPPPPRHGESARAWETSVADPCYSCVALVVVVCVSACACSSFCLFCKKKKSSLLSSLTAANTGSPPRQKNINPALF